MTVYIHCKTDYRIAGSIRRGLIFTVFVVDKHPWKLNQRIIKTVTFFASCQSRRRPYRPHMAMLQYFPEVSLLSTSLCSDPLGCRSVTYTRVLSDSCLPYRFVDVSPSRDSPSSKDLAHMCSTKVTLYCYQRVNFSRHLPVHENE